jgi:hypothetical protein
MGLGAGLDAVDNWKSLFPSQESTGDSRVAHLVA